METSLGNSFPLRQEMSYAFKQSSFLACLWQLLKFIGRILYSVSCYGLLFMFFYTFSSIRIDNVYIHNRTNCYSHQIFILANSALWFVDLTGESEVTLLKLGRPSTRPNCSYCGAQYWSCWSVKYETCILGPGRSGLKCTLAVLF